MESFEGAIPFIGRVEYGENNEGIDLQKYGRVKVRCFGFHSADKSKVPTETLPWATPVVGTFNSKNYKPPESGELVFGMFLDGRAAQHPLILGVVPAMNINFPNSQDGYVQEVTPNSVDNYYQPQLSRLTRGEDLKNTNVASKIAMRTQQIETADGKTWEQNLPAYYSSYPHNHAWETSSGHVIELDDTPGAERLQIFHNSGSYTEIDSNGTIVSKSVGDCQLVVDRNNYVYVEGSKKLTVEGNSNVYIKGNAQLKVDGDFQTTVHGDYNLDVAGHYHLNAGKTAKVKSASFVQEATVGDIEYFSKRNYKIKAGDILSLRSTKNMFLDSKDAVNISGSESILQSSGKTSIKGSSIIFDNTIEVDGNAEITGIARASNHVDGGGSVGSPGSISGNNPKVRLTDLSNPPTEKIVTVNEYDQLIALNAAQMDDEESI